MPNFKPQIDSLRWYSIAQARDDMVKFPHHGLAEYLVLKRYLQQINDNGWISFDVHLPTAYSSAQRLKENTYEKNMAILLELRVDAIIQYRNQFQIVEVKQRLSPSGVGQALIYRQSFQEHFGPKGSINCLVVAERDHVDIRKFANKLGVSCKIV